MNQIREIRKQSRYLVIGLDFISQFLVFYWFTLQYQRLILLFQNPVSTGPSASGRFLSGNLFFRSSITLLLRFGSQISPFIWIFLIVIKLLRAIDILNKNATFRLQWHGCFDCCVMAVPLPFCCMLFSN